MTLDTTPVHAAVDDLEAQHVAIVTELETDVAQLSQQITDLMAEVAWLNQRRATAHSVNPDETLWGIAQLYSTELYPITVQNLKDWNGLTGDIIEVDQLLRLQPALRAEPEPEPEPAQDDIAFSVNVSALGTDADITEADKIQAHKDLLETDNLQNVRVFFGNRPLSWTDARLQALGENDSAIISVSNTRTRAEWDAFWAATPERFRKRLHQIIGCYKHECEAEWRNAGKTQAWLDDYYRGNLIISQSAAASPFPTQTADSVVKIMLWYSQHIDKALIDTMDRFYGGQDFGYFGMDCYHYQVWANNGRYATVDELFGKIIAFCRKIGRLCMIPEWGAERAAGDTTGEGRARVITEGGEHLIANDDVVKAANWWCAQGSKDAQTGLPRQHHLEVDGPDSPEVVAYRALVHR